MESRFSNFSVISYHIAYNAMTPKESVFVSVYMHVCVRSCVGPGDTRLDYQGHNAVSEALQIRHLAVNAALHGNSQRLKNK